jgi:hypothetical protein
MYMPGARRFDMGEKCTATILTGAIAALEQVKTGGIENIAATLSIINSTIAAQLEDNRGQNEHFPNNSDICVMTQLSCGRYAKQKIMPIGDVAGGFLGGVLRAIGSIIADIVLEIAIRGPGYVICRTARRDIDPDDGWVVMVGLAFWGVIGVLGYFAYSYLSEALAVDRCLDSGGAYNYKTIECIRG